jgi:hypothetical protein
VSRTLQVLRDAKQLIASGWTQHAASRETNGKVLYCSTGALCVAANPSADYASTTAYIGAIWALDSVIGAGSPGSIVKWNDERGRTQAEVLAVFDRAISKLEQGA